MAIEIFKLVGSIMVDNDKAKKSISDTGRSAEETGSKFDKLGELAKKAAGVIGAVFTAKAIVDFGKTCINAAEALEQTMKKTNVIFGESASIVEDWALANERTFGLGSGTIQGFMNDIADITQGMGMAKDASIDLAQGATELGVQLANWNGIDAATAINDIQSAMTGSTKGLEKYGIKINDAAKEQAMLTLGLSGTYDKLDNATKAQVIYQAALDASGNAVDYWNEGNRSMSFYLNEAKEQFGNITETIGGFFLPIAKEGAEKIADITANFNGFVTKVAEGINSFREGMAEGEDIVDNIWFVFQDVFGIQLPDSFLTMVSSIIDYFSFLFETMQSIWDTVAVPIIDLIKEAFNTLSQNSDSIFLGIADIFNFAIDYIGTIWSSIGQPIFELIVSIIGWVKDIFMEYWPMISEFFGTFVSDCKSLWENNLKPMFDAIGNFIKTVLAPAFEFVFKNIISPIVGACFKGIIDLWNNSLKPVLTGIIDFLTGVFSGNFTQAFKGIVTSVSGIFKGLISVVKAPLNAVIGLVNKFIGGLNKLQVPDWVPGIGGKGINIPNIPMLAKGTDYFSGSAYGNLAIVGEKGPELVNLPTGSKVNTAKETESLLAGSNGGTFIFQSILNDKVIAETIASASDIVNGKRFNLAERGLVL
ncbi:phage tail protein [Turicibacter sanguinis]|uniref:phage tail protein n=1 Tax=Turicibacter sanguinis TaxID=154288 RepID=UPI00241DAF70|nr:hypothetical protein [Turicibacter sanguinis]